MNIVRGTTTVVTVKPTGSQQRELMGKDVVKMNFVLNSFTQLAIGDKIVVYGNDYYLNQYPIITKVSTFQFNYECEFEAEGYGLNKVMFLNYDNSNELTVSEFPLTLDASGFLDLIIANMNRAGSGWTKGNVDETDVATISFSGDNCRAALSKVAEQFGTEFWFDGKEINFTKKGTLTTHSFEYGKGKGLYEVKRSMSDDKNVFSRLYVYGGTRNIPASYGDRLRLPGTNPYIQKTEQFTNYGLIETSKTWEDIYPHRTGTVSATTGPLSFSDSGMDFDVNDQLIEGVTAKVVFKTGDLAGYEFTVSAYDNASKTFSMLKNKNEKAFEIPSADLKPAVGDKYTIVDIEMPQTYIDAAEAELQTAAEDYYDTNSNGRELYSVDCDPIYFRQQNIDALKVGDFVTIVDTQMGINRQIRIIGIERDLVEQFKYVLTLADTATIATIVREYFEDQQTQIIIRRNNLNNVNKARRNWRNTADLEDLVFDPEGHYYTEKIKPGSIETLYLAVGAKAQNYSLNGVVIKPNYQADANAMEVTSGQLIHYTLKIDGLGSVWQMASASFSSLDPAKAYYLFARVDTTALTGTWKLLEAPVEVDSETGYWNLGVGVLFAVEDGYRNFEFNKGMTYIVGDTIKTGKIQSMDAQNYFNLTSGKFNLGNSTSGLDWDVTNPDTLTIRGGIKVNQGGESEPLGVFRGEYNAATTYYEGDTLTYDGSYWKVISETPISGVTPSDTAPEYKILAKKGATGSGTAVRIIYAKNSDPDNAPTIDTTAHDPTGWSLQMPQIDTYWLLSTQEDDYIVTHDGNEYLTTVDGEYIWASTEVLDENGEFDHWSPPTRISGRNGIPNEYTEYRFQKNGSPTNPPTVNKTDPTPDGWTVEMPDISAIEYLWLIKANKLPDGTLVSAWSDPIRTNGVDGSAAEKGDPGPFMLFRGVWNKESSVTGCSDTPPETVHKQYTGNAHHVDAVKYNGEYYIARSDAGDIPIDTLPTDTAYWNKFSGQFDSLATGLLLAELAYIKNLGVHYVRTCDTGQRIEIDGSNNNLIFYDKIGNEVLRVDDDIDSTQAGDPLAGMKVNDPASGRVAYITGNGLFANNSGMQFLPGTTGLKTNASVVGLLFKRNDDNQGISAAVVGIDGTSSGNSESWGGYFNSLKVTGKVDLGTIQLQGMAPACKQIGNTDPVDYYCSEGDYYLACYNESVQNIHLPNNPTIGKTYKIRRVNTFDVYVKSDNPANLILGDSTPKSSFPIAGYRTVNTFVWDGKYWQVEKSA